MSGALTRLPLVAAGGVTLSVALVTSVLADPARSGLDGADLFTAVTLAGLAVLVATLGPRIALAAVAALTAVWLGGYVVYDQIPELIQAPIPTADAVGAAAYFRAPYLNQQLGGAALIALTLLVGAALTLRRTRPAAEDAAVVAETAQEAAQASEQIAQPSDEKPPARARRIVVAATVLIALTLIPDLHQQLVVQSRAPLDAMDTGWDSANLLTWGYLQQQGFAPMADFWYPYGNAWVLTDFPTGPAVMFFWQAFLLSVAAWSLWRLCGPRPFRIAWCLLAVVVLGLFDIPNISAPPSFWRYAPGLIIAVAYAAVGPLQHRRPTGGHAVLLAACAACAALGPDVFILGLGGMAFVAIGELLAERRLRRPRHLGYALAIDAIPVIGGLAFMIATWALAGTIGENLRWYGEFRTVSAFTAISQDEAGALVGLDPSPALVLLLLTIPALLLVGAFAHRWTSHETARAVSLITLAAAGTSALILAKHLVRPQGPFVLFTPLIALAWSAALLWSRRSAASWLAVGVFVGALAALLEAGANVKLDTYVGNAITVPATIVRNVEQIADRKELHDAAGARFAPERFVAAPEKQFIADQLAGTLGGPAKSSFAVLGDAQILYILFGQAPPDHIDMYSMSPKDAQRDVIAALRRTAPVHLVWRRNFNIDAVPYHVRDPLVFAYAIDTFVPERKSDPWDLLRRRRPGEAVALGYWRARLGETADLGGIPSYSHGAEAPACSGGSDCVPYAAVTGRPAKDGLSKAIVDVRAGRRHFKVALTASRDVERYSIRLDRLWFWPFVASSARLSTATPGFAVRRVDVRAGDDLY